MAGSVTFTNRGERKPGGVKCLVMEWTAAGGAVSGNSSEAIRGEITKIVTVPGTGGVQPDDNYDIVINDEHGIDVALGLLANRDETNAEVVYPGVNNSDGANTAVHRQTVCGALTPVVSNAGGTNEGAIYLYYKE